MGQQRSTFGALTYMGGIENHSGKSAATDCLLAWKMLFSRHGSCFERITRLGKNNGSAKVRPTTKGGSLFGSPR